MSNTVEQIKQRLGIVDVVEAYLKLERAGGALKAKCPFHNEKTPSFFVSPDRGTYYCFGCGAKGDIFEFVERFEGLDFVGALKVLAAKAGVEITRENPKAKSEKDRLYAAMEEAMEFYKRELARNSEAKNYLLARGLSEKTIGEFELGYAPLEWRSVSIHLNKKGWSDAELVKAGLIKMKDTEGPSGSSHYDRFRGRVMFPLFDTSGRVIAFSGRILNDDGKSAKYLNSPETELFSKSKTLYGFDRAKLAIKRMDYSILVEGQMDLIMCHQAGYSNAVASSGTALTKSHLEILKRLSNRIIMAFDADNAGFNASARAWQIALSLGMEVKIAELPKGFDPAELILKNKAEWARAIKESKHIIDFYLDRVLAEESDKRKIALKIKDKVLPFVSAIESNIEKSHFVAKIADIIGINEEAIKDDLKKVKLAQTEEPAGASAVASRKDGEPPLLRKDSIFRKIAGILFWQESKDKPLPFIDKAKENVKKIIGEEDFSELFQSAESSKDRLIFEAEVYYGNKETVENDLDNLIFNLEEEHLKKKRGK